MTDLIKAVQKQEPGSELIELIELELDDDTTLYFHSGLDVDLDKIKFRDKIPINNVYTEREYIALPIELTGIERSTEGASARPSLTVANILTTFRAAVEPFTNKDLVGKRVIRRTTLKKYLVGEDPDLSSPPVEFPTEKFIIDRIAGENKIQLNLELAAVTDLEGVKLPNRIVVGKYCNWEYQGINFFAGARGGCTWEPDSIKTLAGGSTYKAYFNIDDEPVLLYSDVTNWIPDSPTSAIWANDVDYVPNDWVFTVPVAGWKDYWRSEDDSLNSEPTSTNVSWQRVRTYTVYNSSTPYIYKRVIAGEEDPNFLHQYVEYDNGLSGVEQNTTIWRLIRNNTGIAPAAGSQYWVRGDLCGKLLSSCKCRYQFTVDTNHSPFPSYEKNTTVPLHFGGFPGSEKYR